MDDKKPTTFAHKLLMVQTEMPAVLREENNPFFKSRYYNIDGVIAILRPLLSKHGLIVLQPLTTMPDGTPGLETIIKDSEGDGEISRTTPLPQMPDMQKYGGAITYVRRFSLASMFMLESEDDDGNTAVGDKADDAFAKPATPNERQCDGCTGLFKVDSRFPNARKCMQCNIAAKKLKEAGMNIAAG